MLVSLYTEEQEKQIAMNGAGFFFNESAQLMNLLRIPEEEVRINMQ